MTLYGQEGGVAMGTNLAVYKRDADRLGQRLAIVLLPAFPFDHRMWEAVARRFEGIPVVAVDPPGFGRSHLEGDSPSLELYADLVAHALRADGISQALVCGCGMGGCVALAMVERHPKLVRAVAFVGTHAAFDEPETRAHRTEMAISALMGRAQGILADRLEQMLSRETVADHADIVGMLRGWVAEAGDEGIAWAQRAMAQRPGRLEMLARADVKGAVIRGEQDAYVTSEQADQMARALGESYVTSVPRAGHVVPIEQPGVVARAILSLYARAN